jgi:hypothetical protein
MLLAIETGVEPEYEQRLIASALAAGWEVQVVTHIPFTQEWRDMPAGLLERTDVWFHGSIAAVKAAQATSCWQIHAPWDDFQVTQYSQKLGGRMVNFPFNRWLLNQLDDPDFDIFGREAEDDTVFIRPDGANKVFNGGTISKDTFEEQLKLITFYDPPGDTLCCVSKPKRIEQEARFLIVDGKLITGSLYRIGYNSLRLEAPPHLMEEAERALAYALSCGFNPAPSWVLDLGYTGGYWNIMEVGPSACCGLYACDTDKFITALTNVLQ